MRERLSVTVTSTTRVPILAVSILTIQFLTFIPFLAFNEVENVRKLAVDLKLFGYFIRFTSEN